MVYDIWYRDRKFNRALQADGSLNFKDFFKRPNDQEQDPLAIILAGFNREQLSFKEITTPCKLYVSAIQRNSVPNRTKLLVNKIYLKLEPPLPINRTTSQLYHGYEIVKTNTEITVKKYKEVQLRGTWQIKVFGEGKKSVNNRLLEELLQQVEAKQITVRGYVSNEVTEFIYQSWHS